MNLCFTLLWMQSYITDHIVTTGDVQILIFAANEFQNFNTAVSVRHMLYELPVLLSIALANKSSRDKFMDRTNC